MKKTTLLALLVALCTIFSVNMSAQDTMMPTSEAVKNLKPYPVQLDSLVRHVIYLEKRADESLFNVEIIPGKWLDVDCNRHRLIGEFEEETVKGWGYTYHVYETDEHVASTMMACPEPKELKFVEGESSFVRYNSRLPIVVYLPKGVQLKYKIWSAGEEQTAPVQ